MTDHRIAGNNAAQKRGLKAWWASRKAWTEEGRTRYPYYFTCRFHDNQPRVIQTTYLGEFLCGENEGQRGRYCLRPLKMVPFRFHPKRRTS